MGCPLGPYIKKNAPNTIKRKALSEYKDCIWGVDASTEMSILCYCLPNEEGHEYLFRAIDKLLNWMKHDIKIIFVFDGPRPKIKQAECLNRDKVMAMNVDDYAKQVQLHEIKIEEINQQKLEVEKVKLIIEKIKHTIIPDVIETIPTPAVVVDIGEQKVEIPSENIIKQKEEFIAEKLQKELSDQKDKLIKLSEECQLMNEEIDKKKKKIYRTFISKDRYRNLVQILHALQIPTVHSQGEADINLAALYHKGLITHVYGNDYDYVLHGVPLVRPIRGEKSDIQYTHVEEVDSIYFMSTLDVSQKEMAQLGIISGCDYVQDDEYDEKGELKKTRIKGISGIAFDKAYKALKMIKELHHNEINNNTDPEKDVVFEKLFQLLTSNGKNKPCDDFMEKYKLAIHVFTYRNYELGNIENCVDKNIKYPDPEKHSIFTSSLSAWENLLTPFISTTDEFEQNRLKHILGKVKNYFKLGEVKKRTIDQAQLEIDEPIMKKRKENEIFIDASLSLSESLVSP